MYKDLIIKSEESMKKSISFLKEELATIRAGKANPKLIDKIQVSYYGTMTPLNQIANISVPEPRMLLVQPWDANALKDIERAILTSDLGINPTNDGKMIRLIIPVLTEERRKELLKVVKKEIENSKIAVRNIRRDTNDEIKKLEKQSEISKDDLKRAEEEMQKLTDRYVSIIDDIFKDKEIEILEV
ncbi:MAG: ribosome recycling factor [Tissierellia bacterium]|jgi:ribosome recycling factor|nr:ribosome recycling factor [Tissierellia bacterium]MDD3227191.1 ribosome recycling factor [Tissierellia bacterium]MDD3751174.1 ribosome recycling factor [Tissierellia bacterium]MDD4045689.1 ribosome recycling factor [Tissierellia bacterium]MDD4677660.1 ribosome recycling factor [Tissierellia bacterium]